MLALGEGEDVNAVIRRTYPDAMRIASVLPDISCATFKQCRTFHQELHATGHYLLSGIRLSQSVQILTPLVNLKTLNCIRCGACMNTCPVYRRSGGYSYTYFIPGPIGINLGMVFAFPNPSKS